MIGKVKKLLGIEGAKIELKIPATILSIDEHITGSILIKTINPTTIEGVTISIKEIYSRGRGKNKRTDEYILGTVHLETNIDINKNEVAEVTFELPFTFNHSPVEIFANKNIFASAIAKLAKFSKGASSVFSVEAVADEQGTMLKPKDKKTVLFESI